MHTDDLFTLAHWAIDKTRKAIPVSQNLPKNTHFEKKDIALRLVRHYGQTETEKKFIKEINEWNINVTDQSTTNVEVWSETYQKNLKLSEISRLLQAFPDIAIHHDDYIFIEEMAKHGLKQGIGNCSELACYAAILLTELPAYEEKIPIHIVGFTYDRNVTVKESFLGFNRQVPQLNDHVFLVLNLIQGKLNEINSWNDDAVICDPWSNEVYTKKQMLENKTDEELKIIIERFKSIGFFKPHYELQVGKENHTWHWFTKNNNSTFWKPAKLIDVDKRPTLTERIPEKKSSNFVL